MQLSTYNLANQMEAVVVAKVRRRWGKFKTERFVVHNQNELAYVMKNISNLGKDAHFVRIEHNR